MKLIIEFKFSMGNKEQLVKLFKVVKDVPNFDKATPIFFEKILDESLFCVSIPNTEVYYDIVEEQICYVFRPAPEDITKMKMAFFYLLEHLKTNGFNGNTSKIPILEKYLSI